MQLLVVIGIASHAQNGEELPIEIEPTETVSALKAKIQEKVGIEPASMQIVSEDSGAVLDDGNIIEECDLVDSSRVVCGQPPQPPPTELPERPSNSLVLKGRTEAPIAVERNVQVLLLANGEYMPIAASTNIQLVQDDTSFQLRIFVNMEVFAVQVLPTDRLEAALNDDSFMAVSDARSKATYGFKFSTGPALRSFARPANEALRRYLQERVPVPRFISAPEKLRGTGSSITVGWHLPDQAAPVTQGFELEMDEGAPGTSFRLIATFLEPHHLSWTQHSLKSNTPYAFRVRANTLRGDTEWSLSRASRPTCRHWTTCGGGHQRSWTRCVATPCRTS